MANIQVYPDMERLTAVASAEQRRVMVSAIRKPFGKLFYAIPRLQVIPWKSYSVARRMLLMYLAAKDYYIQSGIPKDLVELVVNTFGNVKGKPIKPKLLDSILFGAAAWHIRFACAFNLLKNEFEYGKNVESYGCGSGIIEILALVASQNRDTELTLIDFDSDGIDLAKSLVTLFWENGYDIRGQVEIKRGDIRECVPKSETDTVVSIGLVHNYFSMGEANTMLRNWFEAGAGKVITDIYHNPNEVDDGINDAKLKISFVKDVLGWKIGEPDGLCFYGKKVFCDCLSEFNIDVYDHGLNSTMVLTSPY